MSWTWRRAHSWAPRRPGAAWASGTTRTPRESVCVCVLLCVYVCVCVCWCGLMCVLCVCVCVCVCVLVWFDVCCCVCLCVCVVFSVFISWIPAGTLTLSLSLYSFCIFVNTVGSEWTWFNIVLVFEFLRVWCWFWISSGDVWTHGIDTHRVRLWSEAVTVFTFNMSQYFF